MVYLGTFAFTTVLLYGSTKFTGPLRVILILLGLSLPCLLAGLRDETVGNDVLTYAKRFCFEAQLYQFDEFIEHESRHAALGWNVFTWLAVRATGGLSGYLFAIEAACLIPVYTGLRRLYPNYEWAGILVWLLLCYAFTLNGMRQSIAMASTFYSFVYIKMRKPFKFLICVIVATLFHQTAIVALLFYPFSSILVYGGGIMRPFGKYQWFVVSVLLIVAAFVLFRYGAEVVRAASVFKESYTYQVTNLDESDLSIAGLYLLAMFTVLWYFARNEIRTANTILSSAITDDQVKLFTLLSALMVIGSAAWQFNLIVPSLGRLGYYATSISPILGSMFASRVQLRGSYVFLTIIAFGYFTAMILILGKEGVMPYTSAILGL